MSQANLVWRPKQLDNQTVTQSIPDPPLSQGPPLVHPTPIVSASQPSSYPQQPQVVSAPESQHVAAPSQDILLAEKPLLLDVSSLPLDNLIPRHSKLQTLDTIAVLPDCFSKDDSALVIYNPPKRPQKLARTQSLS